MPHCRKSRSELPVQVTDDVMAAADKQAVFMHCLPMHREERVAASGGWSAGIVFDQAENRLRAQGALVHTSVGEIMALQMSRTIASPSTRRSMDATYRQPARPQRFERCQPQPGGANRDSGYRRDVEAARNGISHPWLAGKRWDDLQHPSTELALFRRNGAVGGTGNLLGAQDLQLKRGETIEDTAAILATM